MRDNKQVPCNSKLKVLMPAVMIAVVVNAIISAYAPTILDCAQRYDPPPQNVLGQILIKIGSVVHRAQAYSHIQEARILIYSWLSLALLHGAIWSKYLVGIAIA